MKLKITIKGEGKKMIIPVEVKEGSIIDILTLEAYQQIRKQLASYSESKKGYLMAIEDID